ncbi:MAG: anhydro-N-acetylmuramic acid kinase [Alphaproteobacteria bacterium]|nr:anhydro-N-acetylmuramic acid kinase [Alphaproteobacteria bacterium]
MPVKTIGVMTGNSLDAVDAVLTEFNNGQMTDLSAYTIKYPQSLTQAMLRLRSDLTVHGGETEFLKKNDFFDQTVAAYTSLVAETVNALCAQAGADKSEIAAIGLHGQTCDHFPPSVAGSEPPYTLQIADAASLANKTDIPVIYDFRSDDLMNGGEAAPLAPVHNRHLCRDLKKKGVFPVAFCNAGNTGNITVVSEDAAHKESVSGWDIGPFNHFADRIVRIKKAEPCDKDGLYGQKGEIIPELLSVLFDTIAVTRENKNFYLQSPPKSSDPAWYRLNIEETCSEYGFENTLRTIEYLSAYSYVHTLGFVPEAVKMPDTFLLFGGGWKNPLTKSDFQNLLNGKGLILTPHKELFSKIYSRFAKQAQAEFSDTFGYSGEYMEARIFADMAYCRIVGEPFSLPETTGCKSPTVAGIYVLPQTGKKYLLETLFERYRTADIINNNWSEKYSRAAKGWQNRRR